MSDAKPYSAGDVPDEMTCTDCGEPDCCLMEEQARIIATVEALEKAEAERDEARTALIRAVSDKTVLSDERDEARACLADAMSVVLDPATSGEHWSILPSVVENLRDERDALKATVNDALEQLRHEEHLRTTAERAVAEAAERLDEFGACPTVADGIQAMRLRLIEARAEVALLRETAALRREALDWMNTATSFRLHEPDDCDFDTQGGQRDCPWCVAVKLDRAALKDTP